MKLHEEKLRSYNAAVRGWEAQCEKLRAFQEKNSSTATSYREMYEVNKGGFAFTYCPVMLDKAGLPRISENGEQYTTRIDGKEVVVARKDEVQIQKSTPKVDFPSKPSKKDYFRFTPDEAKNIARRILGVDPTGYHAPYPGKGMPFGKDVSPEEERYTFTKETKRVDLGKETVEVIFDGSRGWRTYHTWEVTVQVLLVFSDRWELHQESFYEDAKAAKSPPSGVGDAAAATSRESDGMWRK